MLQWSNPRAKMGNRANFKNPPIKRNFAKQRGGSTTGQMSTLVNGANKRRHVLLRFCK